MKRRSLRRFCTLAIAGFLLLPSALGGSPVAAAPERPEVRLARGVVTFDAFLRPTAREGGPTLEYGATERFGIRAQWLGGLNLGVKYEVSPNLALEGYVAPSGRGGLKEAEYGFGLLAGQQFGPLYASLRWREAGFPVDGTRIWLNQLVAMGSYSVSPQANLLGSLTATLGVGVDWRASYGVEWQATQEAAVYVNRFPSDDLTQVGVEYRF
jgi:hypothetical protein